MKLVDFYIVQHVASSYVTRAERVADPPAGRLATPLREVQEPHAVVAREAEGAPVGARDVVALLARVGALQLVVVEQTLDFYLVAACNDSV